jgi:hypothetical protein
MICAPIFDLPTRSSAGALIRYVLPRFPPPPLVGPVARRPFFSLLIPHTDVLVASGHGLAGELSGQNEDPLWVVGSYDPKEVAGKVCYLVCCECGQELAPDLVQTGKAKAVLAFDADLFWIVNSAYRLNPWDCPDAQVVMLPIMNSINLLLDGATCSEAFALEKAGFLTNAANTDDDLQRSILEYNAAHAVLCGDPSATISARPRIFPKIPPPPLFF